MSERDLIERLRAKLPGIQTPMMGGDNLAITLCSYFDNPSQPNDENGWSEDAVRGQYEVLDAIHAHYATTIARLSEALAEAEKKGAEAEEAKRAERHRIFRLLWDHSEHVNAYSLGLLVKDDVSVIKALPPRDLSQGGQHG